MEFHKYNPNQIIEAGKIDSSDIINNGTITLRQLFTEILDVFGKPGRKF